MSYSNFKKILQIKENFGITIFEKNLFENIKSVVLSEWLKTTLSYSSLMRSKNEKTKSESIVQPILIELIKRNKNFITIFSGNNLDVDIEKGLNGECDFIITKDTGQYDLESPIFQIVEAKEDDMKHGVSQCAAQMYAASLFNKINNIDNIDCIYGCVTTADNWLFMKLLDKKLFIDKKKYYLSEVENILGVFQTIIDSFKIILPIKK